MHRYHDARSIAPTHQGAELKQLTYEADELREQQAAHRQWRRRVRRVLKQHAVAAESAAAAEGNAPYGEEKMHPAPPGDAYGRTPRREAQEAAAAANARL